MKLLSRARYARLWFALVALGLLSSACGDAGDGDDAASSGDSTVASSTSEESGSSAGVEGVERSKPAPGTGNVQGEVLYNGKPVAGIEVTLCEEFNRFGNGCGGATFMATTDSTGTYVITGVPPKKYGALLAKVFDTESYVFATTGITGLSSETYDVVADKTLFMRPTNLFKSDLKVSSPKAGSSVAAQGLALAWDSYPDAAYYKFSLFPDSAAVMSPYITYRVDSNGFAVAKPLTPGEYRLEVEAFNDKDIKLAETVDDLKFQVN
ncbi:MAG TPA: carboxypeptidase-like regulatory domain-containing protein [Candidatus Kapabacteria bacterium]|jgi:hypothetical protein|nr:carboxypeptidase-like regulatory domain-containing protein [Candidatus Kapabacteria bacterium]